MALLDWKPEYSVGVEAVDFEHREMIGMINELDEALGVETSPEAIEAFLGDIHAGISAHFALEERAMRVAAYPEYEAHKEDHEDLLDQLRELMDHYAAEPVVGRKLLQATLGGWFKGHFSSFDARLHKQLGSH